MTRTYGQDRRWKVVKQNDQILAQLSELNAFKDSYEQKMQAAQFGFESRLDKLENDVALVLSNTTTIMSVLEKFGLSKKKSKPVVKGSVSTKIKDDRRSYEPGILENQNINSDSQKINSGNISAPKATAELVILALAPTYNPDSSDEDDDVGRPGKMGTKRTRKKKKGFLDPHSLRYFFGISKPDTHTNQPGSRVVHPDSPFMAGLDVLAAILLIYCVCIVPLQLSLWSDPKPCEQSPTQGMDMFVDLFFMMEILIRFVVGIDVNGRYCDDYRVIAWRYATSPSGLVFDAVTSIPISWVDYSLYSQGCSTGSKQGAEADVDFRGALKTLRIFKLIRLLKVFKLFSVMEDRLEISPGNMRIFKIFFTLIVALHVYSCAFWRVKMETYSREELEEFLVGKAADPGVMEIKYVQCVASEPEKFGLCLSLERIMVRSTLYVSTSSAQSLQQ